MAEQEPQAVPVPLHVCEPVIALPVGQVYEQDCVLLGEQVCATVQVLEAVGDQEPVETDGLPVEPFGHVVVTVCVCVKDELSDVVK